jgi:hypothetical protein
LKVRYPINVNPIDFALKTALAHIKKAALVCKAAQNNVQK